MSPDFFILLGETILREAQSIGGVKIGGEKNLNNIRYADDFDLMSETESGLRMLVTAIDEAISKKGLK